MECLRAQPGESTHQIDIQIRNGKFAKMTPVDGMTPAAVTIAEVGRDCAEEPLVGTIRDQILNEYLKLLLCGQLDLIQVVGGAFTSGFAYGVRVGIEMERQEMSEVRL